VEKFGGSNFAERTAFGHRLSNGGKPYENGRPRYPFVPLNLLSFKIFSFWLLLLQMTDRRLSTKIFFTDEWCSSNGDRRHKRDECKNLHCMRCNICHCGHMAMVSDLHFNSALGCILIQLEIALQVQDNEPELRGVHGQRILQNRWQRFTDL
jgi:hypothetical protein